MRVGTAMVVVAVTVTVMVLLSSGTAGTRISCSYLPWINWATSAQ